MAVAPPVADRPMVPFVAVPVDVPVEELRRPQLDVQTVEQLLAAAHGHLANAVLPAHADERLSLLNDTLMRRDERR